MSQRSEVANTRPPAINGYEDCPNGTAQAIFSGGRSVSSCALPECAGLSWYATDSAAAAADGNRRRGQQRQDHRQAQASCHIRVVSAAGPRAGSTRRNLASKPTFERAQNL